MIGALVSLAFAGDPAVDALADGAVRAEVAVQFGTPRLPRWYDGGGYAAAFPAQWRASGVAVCWLAALPTAAGRPV